ncbi:MAG: FAD-dependent oxidoreductase, partial [Traorella sp.]
FKTRTGNICHALTKEEIQEMIHGAAVHAKCAKEFGFDVIQVGLGYEGLLAQFLSPYYNHREDEYGGCLENRLRFAKETLIAVREAVGILKPYVDMIHVSSGMDMVPGQWEDDPIIDSQLGLEGWYRVNGKHCQSIFEPNLTNVSYAKAIKEAYPDMLVSVVGSIMTPEQGESLIKNNIVDAIVMARPLTADPFLPRKAMSGHRDDIVPCIRCLYCYHTATVHGNTQCSVNPRYRRENRIPEKIEKVGEKKKVVVIGGGPAGMKASIVAAQRGHEVILCEKTNELGGQLKYARYENRKLDLVRYLDYLICQVNKHAIQVCLNTTVDANLLQEINPDAVLVCIGAELITPKIKGHEYAIDCLTALENQQKIGNKVVIVGGGQIGIELGLELSDHQHQVDVIEKSSTIAANGNMLYHIGLVEYLKTKDNIHSHVNCECLEITDKGVWIKENGLKQFIEADSVITAVGFKSKKEEAFDLYGIADETFTIGDCDHVGKVLDATNDAFFIAYNL